MPPEQLFDFDTLTAIADANAAVLAGRGGPVVVPEVRVIRSDKRLRTVSARLVNGVMELRIPARTSAAEEERWIAEMLTRLRRKKVTDCIDLMARAKALASQLELPVPDSIRWVTNQQHRWGSCTPVDRAIRISDKLVGAPLWVLDYVIVHEMAHLRYANHGPRFWSLVNRYPKTERARGYLMALGNTEDTGD